MRSLFDSLRNRVVPALLTAAGIALVAAGLFSYSAPADAGAEASKPDAKAREAIWRGLIPRGAPLAKDVDFGELAKRYDFCGGTIKNIVMRAAFEAALGGADLTVAQGWRWLGSCLLLRTCW